MPTWLRRAAHWNYLTPGQDAAKDFLYGVFDHLSQVAQLPLGQSYLHASSMEKDGRGVALVACGGAGKTTAMLKLVLEHQWRYLSDDLALVDDSGILLRTPKRMQIYAYNLEGERVLQRRVFAGRSPMDRASWYLHRQRNGSHGVRRRMSAEELFDTRHVAQSATLSDVLFLQRIDAGELSSRPLDRKELVRRAIAILWTELRPLEDILTAMVAANMRPTFFPSRDDVERQTTALLEHALTGPRLRLIYVPKNARPNALISFIRRELGDAA